MWGECGRAFFNRLGEDATLRPDLGRAVRATLAFALPLMAGTWIGVPFEASFAAMTAQNLAMVDVRGAYRVRLALLLAMLLVLGGAVALGGLGAGHLGVAVAATALIALAGGLWRHVSPEYGPALAVSSSLVFFIALSAPPERTLAHLGATLAGGGLGLILQMALWPVRPQHPLRRTVAETWLAAAALFARMEPTSEPEADAADRRAEAEGALRAAVNQAERTLEGAGIGDTVAGRLAGLNLAAARLAVRAAALWNALEEPASAGARRRLTPCLAPVFEALAELGRAVALAVVSRQPAHVAGCEVRLRRLGGLLAATEARALAGREDVVLARYPALLTEVGAALEALGVALREAVARAGERAAFPMELLALETWRLRALGAAVDLSPRLDPALVRHSLRLAALTCAGVLAFKLFGWAHGYWLPFTIVVVLQPDYGSTRVKAAQRVAGTLAGGIVAGLILQVNPPEALRQVIILGGVFVFCHQVRRNYAVAIAGVTIFVVLMLEPAGSGLALTMERFLATLAGGLLALGAALVFWPAWERDRLPPLLARALRANRDYLAALTTRLAEGGEPDATVVAAKRAAESANATVFSSLRRLFADPANRRERVERLAALANGNQRVTRQANVVLVQLRTGEPAAARAWDEAARAAGAALEALATRLETTGAEPAPASGLAACALELDLLEFPPADGRAGWITRAYAQAAAEARAMLAAG